MAEKAGELMKIQPRRSWGRTVAFLLMLAPMTMFVLVLVNLILNSIPVVTEIGLGAVFSTRFSSFLSGEVYMPGRLGLYPAMWGTFMVAVEALIITVPVSLAMAIFAQEFTLGGMGRWMESLLALFAGIPPIIYAMLSLFFAKSFIGPLLMGADLPDGAIYDVPGITGENFGMAANLNNLLGGIFLSMLVIPFMAPLILDALRSVPASLKEASYGLGANRWFTLLRVSLPSALPGIVVAVSLGLLKVIGDVIISIWTMGYGRNGMPNPLFDVFERTSPLSSTGAGLVRALAGAVGMTMQQKAVAYFSAFLLLVMAFAILGLASVLQRRLQRRWAK